MVQTPFVEHQEPTWKEYNGNELAGPFLKWAGGKTQLLPQFTQYYPSELVEGGIHRYFEPFVGGGAVFFDLAQRYNVQAALLSDANPDLILIYLVVQREVDSLIEELRVLSNRYKGLGPCDRQRFYYEMRETYNSSRSTVDFRTYTANWVARASIALFLNKTCFNGLYRVNRRGDFNVPFGRYANPTILNEANLRLASKVLSCAEITCADFSQIETQVDSASFVYFDPPYRPLTNTARFTQYHAVEFSDDEQARLAQCFRRLDSKGAKVMLSNSDPSSSTPSDSYFETLYEGYYTWRVSANRMINCNAERRGRISELLITNYLPLEKVGVR